MSEVIQSAVGVAAIGMPEGKTRALLQFNKVSGAFTMMISYVDPTTLNNDYYVYEEAYVDFENDTVVGKYPNHEIKSMVDAPPQVVESILEENLREKITKRYSVVKQINIISDVVESMVTALKPLVSEDNEKLEESLDALLEMRDYINDVKLIHDNRVEYYKNSPEFEFISKETHAKLVDDQLEGGLHEVYGPRETTGGRVF